MVCGVADKESRFVDISTLYLESLVKCTKRGVCAQARKTMYTPPRRLKHIFHNEFTTNRIAHRMGEGELFFVTRRIGQMHHAARQSIRYVLCLDGEQSFHYLISSYRGQLLYTIL